MSTEAGSARSARRCERCGTPLTAYAPKGLCPACLLVGGLESGMGAAAEDAPGRNASTLVIPASQQPGDRIDRYKLLQQIGEGGWGIVYMAEQTEPVRRRVALKVIKLGMDTRQVIARFEAERQALALMDHPNIAKVLDAGATETGRPYFVMELVRGIKITDYCDQNHLDTGQRLQLFIQICQAIQHAHQKGIIHRDIKPSNILVTLHDGVPVPKVIDFGIAKATTDQQLTDKTLFTAYEQFIGTPAYMSPEQAEMSGLDIDTRSDIYSLGVLLYELLTGRTPFDTAELLKSGLEALRRTIREREPLRPSTRLRTLPGEELTTTARCHGAEAPKLISLLRGDLDWIVMKCLEKDRARRYETANGLVRDIQRHLNSEPVVARPPSAGYRVWNFVRRNKVMVSAAGLVTLALIAGLATTTWMFTRERRAEREQTRLRIAAQQAQADEATQRQRAQAGERSAQRLLYDANMELAEQAWKRNNFGRVLELLNVTGAYPARGFEWYYWERQTHLELECLRGHTRGVNGVAFSPDGQRIVTGSDDSTAKVWDAASGQELFTLRGHRGPVNSVAFSPGGRRIVTGGMDCTARVWDAVSGRQLLILEGHTGPITCVAFSPDGQRIVTGSADATAKVWDAASGRELFSLDGHTGPVLAAAFSPDDRRIVTGGADMTARVWDAADGQEVLTLHGHSAKIVAVAFSADGRRVLTGSPDQTARVWQAATVEEVAAWQREERAAADRLRVLLREESGAEERARALRARDPGAIRQWLVLAPIPYEDRRGAVALDQEQLPNEAFLRPHAGQRVKVGSAELVWSATKLEDYRIDFNELLGEQTEWAVAYAVCYIQSEAPRKDVSLRVGSDDEAKIYLNGRQIYRDGFGRDFVPDEDLVEGLDLRAGVNVLVFKVVNQTLFWRGSVRFTGASGQPLKGIRVTLTPP